jgi:hypothetical protein
VIAVVNITDTMTARNRAILDSLQSTRPLMARLGKTAETIMKNRFEDLQRRPNARGWPKRNFWNQVRQSTALTGLSEREATVAVSDPRYALQLHGGTVRAKRASMLAIPLHAEAYQAGSPGEGSARLPNLFVLRRRGGRGAFLAEAESFANRGTLRLWYVLKPSVTVPRNPDAMVSEGDMAAALDGEATAYLERAAQGGGTT